ncbi:YcnI family copper-binding membrane protein [Streptomyces durbertensis]
MPMHRAATTLGVSAFAVLALAGPALAHVTVDPAQAPAGGYATINFKVPNERDNASTTRLEVTLPTDQPLTSVMPEPVPGWEVKVDKGRLDKPLESHGRKIDEVPVKITWSGGSIDPGTFQRFPVSVGRLPEDADRLVFKAVQTYDNKEVVRWIEVPDGDTEPDNPAPVLALGEPAADHHGGGAHSGDSADARDAKDTRSGDAPQKEAAASDVTASDPTARLLAGIGIAAGVGGIAFGVLAGRRRTGAEKS